MHIDTHRREPLVCITVFMAQPPAAWKRLASTTTTSTFTAKTAPSKAYLHKPIPDDLFPRGYLVGGVHSGVKKDASALDLAVLLSSSPKRQTSAAASFTRNAFQAAPVTVSKDVLSQTLGRARALVVNSGCANAVTGRHGLADAWAMARATDALLTPSPSLPSSSSETLVMSTGVIGQPLPISKILAALRPQGPLSTALGQGFAAWDAAARAFMTTDTFPKLRARALPLGDGRTYRIAGIDKGAGMIHPDMLGAPPPLSQSQLHATLLGCIATDAPVAPAALQSALDYAVQRSFNAISIDGDMSTNDTVVLFANGAGGAGVGAEGEGKGESKVPVREIDEAHDPGAFLCFRDGLTDFMQELAQLVVRDGEGATKFVTVSVEVRACVLIPGVREFLTEFLYFMPLSQFAGCPVIRRCAQDRVENLDVSTLQNRAVRRRREVRVSFLSSPPSRSGLT